MDGLNLNIFQNLFGSLGTHLFFIWTYTTSIQNLLSYIFLGGTHFGTSQNGSHDSYCYKIDFKVNKVVIVLAFIMFFIMLMTNDYHDNALCHYSPRISKSAINFFCAQNNCMLEGTIMRK